MGSNLYVALSSLGGVDILKYGVSDDVEKRLRWHTRWNPFGRRAEPFLLVCAFGIRTRAEALRLESAVRRAVLSDFPRALVAARPVTPAVPIRHLDDRGASGEWLFVQRSRWDQGALVDAFHHAVVRAGEPELVIPHRMVAPALAAHSLTLQRSA